MQFSKLWYLQHLNLFEQFTQAELLTVARVMDMEELEKQDRIFQIGEPAGNVYLLMEGHVKIYRRGPSGRRMTLAILKPGEIFGDNALTAAETHEQGAEALEPSIVGSMTESDFRALLERKPSLALRVIQYLSWEKRTLERKITSLVFKDVPARLAETLLELSDEYGQPCTHGLVLELVITQQELADLIGATRSVVNVTLKQLQQEGMISLRRRRICFANRDGLRRIAEALNSIS
jgi:CRP/FNR family cyclic AMP-dependent transcriptional regulator